MNTLPMASSPRPPPQELFFLPLQIRLKPDELEQVRFAYICSKHGHGHKGKLREDGTRQFDHPKSATWILIDQLELFDADALTQTLLHDMPEDSFLLSHFRIGLNFGIQNACGVGALTKLPKGKETTKQYLYRIVEQGWRTIIAKLADRLHNLRTLAGRPLAKRIEQIEETEAYHLPILIPALRSHGGDCERYADLLEQMIRQAIANAPLEPEPELA